MVKPWKGQLHCPGSAARLSFRLKDVHGNASLRESDGGGKAVGAGADDSDATRLRFSWH